MRLICLPMVLMLFTGCRPASEAERNDATPAGDVQQHLEELLSVARQHSVRREQVDWVTLRAKVLDVSGRSAEPLRRGIATLLEGLADGHSFYVPVGGSQMDRIGVFAPCEVTTPTTPPIPPSIGYVRVPGSSQVPKQDAADILRQIHEAERVGVGGWIVDLRGNTGGTIWPMLEGLRPLLGDSTAGYFVDSNGSAEPWGASRSEIAPSAGFERSRRRIAAHRIAVLTDRATVSAGEAIAVAFRSIPTARSFGEATCGRSSANRAVRLSNGAVLYLTTAYVADRTGWIYQGVIEPDENVPQQAVIRRAVEWLTSGEALRP